MKKTLLPISFVAGPVAVLYFAYASFFIGALLHSNQSAVSEYISSVAGMVVMSLALLLKAKRNRMSIWSYAVFVLVVSFAFASLLATGIAYTTLLIIKVAIFIYFFSAYAISQESITKFINYTYLCYLAISVFVWLGLVPNIFYVYPFLHDYHVDMGLFSYYIMLGIEGSPANIDAYSATVLLMNMTMNSSRDRRVFIALALFGVLASFRMTPIMSLMIVAILYPLYSRGRVLGTITLASVVGGFSLLLLGIYHSVQIPIASDEVDIGLIAYAATHARSMIWSQQLELFLSNYHLFDYLFGHYVASEFSVPLFQMDGSEAGSDEFNPHNNFLLLLYRSPIWFLVSMIMFFIAHHKSYSKYTFPIVLNIFLAALTNSSLISLGNPVYLVILAWIVVGNKPGERMAGVKHI